MEIIGRLTRDAETKTFDSGKQVVNFDIANTETYKPKGSTERKENTIYLRCAYWMGTGVAKYLTKGTLVELQGRLGVDAYTNKEGKAVGVITLNVRNIKLHGAGKSANATKEPVVAAPVAAGELTEPLDDLPF